MSIIDKCEEEGFLKKNEIDIIFASNGNEPRKKKKDLGLSPKAVFTQLLMTILANFSILSPGMGYSYPAITFDALTNENSTMAITLEQASWFASVSAINIPIGSLICGYILDLYGRKLTLVLLNIMSIISWGIMASASTTDRDAMYIQIMIARVLMGILTGISTSPAGIYGAEVAHKNLRGRLLVLSTLFTSVGMLISYFLGFVFPNDWRLIASIACGISVFSLVVLFVIPETPPWLASKGKVEAAEMALRTFKGLPKKGSFVNSELRIDIDYLREQSAARYVSNAESLWTKCKRPEVYKPFFIMVMFFTFQQTSGIFVVMVYAVQFSKSSGISIDPFLCSIFIGLTRVIATIIIGISMDIYGRRKPAMTSGFLTALCMFGIFLYSRNPIPSINWLPVILIIAYVFTSALGILTLPFTMNSEVYPQDVRGFAGGLSLSVGFIVSFVVLKLYPALSLYFGHHIFIIFGCISFISIFFVYAFLPETKGKSLDEIKNLFIKQADRPVCKLSTIPEENN